MALPTGLRKKKTPDQWFDPAKPVQPAEANQPPAQTGSMGAQTTPMIQPRALSAEAQGLYDSLQKKMSAAPVSAQDIMNSGEYQSQASALDFQGEMDQAGLRRSLAARRMLRSTPAVQAMSAEQLRTTAAKQALVPSMLQAAWNRQQTDIANTRAAMSDRLAMEGQAFNQGLNEFQATAPYTRLTEGQRVSNDQWERTFAANQAVTEANITGRYLSPAAKQLWDRVISLKEKAESGVPTEEIAGLSGEATKLRSELDAMGYDSSLLGANVTAAQARANLGKLGIQTPQAQLSALQQQREKILLDNAQLESQIAQNPEYGATAQAKLRMDEAQKQLKLIDAQIASTYALAQDRLTDGSSGGLTPYQQYQINKDMAEMGQKARDAETKKLTTPYDITPIAANVWVDFDSELGVIAQGAGGQLDREKAAGIMRGLLNTPGLTSKDRYWIAAMFAQRFGDAEAGQHLSTFRKDYDK